MLNLYCITWRFSQQSRDMRDRMANQALLDTLADTLARVALQTGDLREALRLFVALSLPDAAEGQIPMTAGQRRLSQSAPLPAARDAATLH